MATSSSMESEGSRTGEWRLLGLVGVGDVMIVVSQGSCKQGESTYTDSFRTRGFLENSMRPVPGLVMSVNISKAFVSKNQSMWISRPSTNEMRNESH